MPRIRFLLFFLITAVIITVVCGCRIEEYGNLKSNVISINEYNDVVASYNKLVTSFTGLARLVDKNIGQQDEADNNFWDKFESGKQEVFSCVAEMNECKLQDKGLDSINEKIKLLVSKIEEYISMIEINKSYMQNASRRSLSDMHRAFYNEILELSSDIVFEFDSVYEQMVSE